MMYGLHVKKVYDGTWKGEAEDAVVVVDGGRIAEILPYGDREKMGKYDGMILEDLTDLYLVPGLIDSHVHLMMPGNGMKGEEVTASMSQGEIQLVAGENARVALFMGVTTMRDCGGIADVTFSLKHAIEKGLMKGPDLLVCGAPVTSTGGHIHYMGGEADGPEEVRSLVRRQKKLGADFVKLVATGGGTRGVVVKGENLTHAELDMAVREAHRVHLKATAHVNSTEGIKAILETDIDGIEHCYFSSFDGSVDYRSDLAEQVMKRGIMVCQTLEVMQPKVNRLKSMTGRSAFDEKEYKRLSLFQERLFDMHRMMLRDGVEFIAGTDAGWNECPFGRVWEGLKLLSDCGMDNQNLLHSATGKAADWLGISERAGYVRKGLQADLLLVQRDPMEDISNLRLVERVYKNGIRVR